MYSATQNNDIIVVVTYEHYMYTMYIMWRIIINNNHFTQHDVHDQ